MAWIESHQDMATNPKTRRAARLLDVPIPQVIGHLHMLWWWALDHAFEGDLSDFEPLDLADACAWDGDPDVFVDALVGCGPRGKAGFLVRDGDDLAINDWAEFTQHLRAKREASLKGNHTRHHVNKGVVEASCPLCQESQQAPADPPAETQDDPDGVAADPPATPDTVPEDSQQAPNGVPRERVGTPPEPEPEPEPGPTGTEPKPVAPRGGAKRGTRLPDDWQPDPTDRTVDDLVARLGGPAAAAEELDKFRDYWLAKSGKDATKLDWQRTWRNWLRTAAQQRASPRPRPPATTTRTVSDHPTGARRF